MEDCGLADGVVAVEEEAEPVDVWKEGALLDIEGLDAPRGLYTGGGAPASLDRFAVAVLNPAE